MAWSSAAAAWLQRFCLWQPSHSKRQPGRKWMIYTEYIARVFSLPPTKTEMWQTAGMAKMHGRLWSPLADPADQESGSKFERARHKHKTRPGLNPGLNQQDWTQQSGFISRWMNISSSRMGGAWTGSDTLTAGLSWWRLLNVIAHIILSLSRSLFFSLCFVCVASVSCHMTTIKYTTLKRWILFYIVHVCVCLWTCLNHSSAEFFSSLEHKSTIWSSCKSKCVGGRGWVISTDRSMRRYLLIGDLGESLVRWAHKQTPL